MDKGNTFFFAKDMDKGNTIDCLLVLPLTANICMLLKIWRDVEGRRKGVVALRAAGRARRRYVGSAGPRSRLLWPRACRLGGA
jgi:hypothetical protein